MQPAPAPTPAPPTGRGRWAGRAVVLLRCLAAGATIALSIPPFGWWPLAFLGVAQWDLLVAGQRPAARARRTFLVCCAWLFPMMLWMYDLTPPGYVIASVGYSVFFSSLVVWVPAHRPALRSVGMVAAISLGELWRWCWPFEGVPLATLAESQADAPLAQAARLLNAIGVSMLVAVGGVAVAAAVERRWRAAGVGLAVLVTVPLLGLVAPRGTVVEGAAPVRVAIVQGGGRQRTPFEADPVDVFRRHLQATERITAPVDLVVWPENVLEPSGPHLDGSPEDRQLRALAQRLHAPIIVGVTEDDSPSTFVNYSIVYNPDGTVGDRYDKARRVPFGEWVPFRSLITAAVGSGGIPARDAVPGTAPAVVRTTAGPVGLMISWEVFFTDRGADGVAHGAEIIANPTNGSSYWLTQVQTQQIASSRLRAIETGRWELQAAPTGFSTVIDPSGRMVDCDRQAADGTVTTGRCRADVGNEATAMMSDQVVLLATVERRTGDTVALRVGPWPVLLGSIAALVAVVVVARRNRTAPTV